METLPIKENKNEAVVISSSVNKKNNPILYFAYTFLGTGLIIGLTLLGRFYNGNISIADLGTILSGSVGSVWALSGVFFFIYNLQQQKETLALQREELAFQREELKNQVTEMKTANETAFAQQRAISEQTSNSLF